MSDDSGLLLGKATEYPKAFSRKLLTRIPRALARQDILAAAGSLDFHGYDLWTIYELGWLSQRNAPQVALAELRVPADSEYIVESKSLKLYLNGFSYRQFDGFKEVHDEIVEALSTLLGSSVSLSLFTLNNTDNPLLQFNGENGFDKSIEIVDLDALDIAANSSVEPALLRSEEKIGAQKIYRTDLFRSLCPVTGQPDWATFFVALSGAEIDAATLSAYLLGYREHQGFHENCAERIFSDISVICEPTSLTVAARFTRRGGIDINPYRSTRNPVIDMPGRCIRQ